MVSVALLTLLLAADSPATWAQAPSAAGGSGASGAAPSGAAGAQGTATSPGLGAGQAAAIAARPLSLADVVTLAVGGNSGLQIARIRLQRAQELVNQVNAQARPQFRVSANDAYNSYPAFPSVIPLPVITNPTLPDSGVIPTVIDQAAGISTGFVGGTLQTGGLSTSASPGISTGGSATAGGAGTTGAAAGTPGAAAAPGGVGTSGSTGSNSAGGTGTAPGGASTPGNGGAGTGTAAPGSTGTPGNAAPGASTSPGSTSPATGTASPGTGTSAPSTGAGAGTASPTTGGNSGTGTASPGASASPGANTSPGTGTAPSNTGTGNGTASPNTGNGNSPATGAGTSTPTMGTGLGLLFIPALVTDYVADPRTLALPPATAHSSERSEGPRASARRAAPETEDAPQNDATAQPSTEPRATADPTTGTDDAAVSRAVGKRDTYAAGGSVTQYIDLFGITGAARGAEQSAQRFYALDITRLQNETALVAKNLFFNALYAQALVATQEEQVRFALENVRITQSRLRNGIVSRYDVLTAQSQLANAQQSLLAAQDQLSQAQANLAYLLGTDPDRSLTLLSPPLPPLDQSVNLPQSTRLALQRRPELAQAQSTVAEARNLARLAGNGLLPVLGLVGSGEYTSNGSTVTPRSYASVSAQLAIPLDDGGQTRSRVRAARLDVQTQTLLSEQLSLSVSLEVRQAAINIRNAQGQVAAAQAGLVQAEEARRLALERYTAGLGTFLDVLNAQATLAATRTNLASAQLFYQSSLAQFVRALGGR